MPSTLVLTHYETERVASRLRQLRLNVSDEAYQALTDIVAHSLKEKYPYFDEDHFRVIAKL